MKAWEALDHTSDLELVIRGSSEEELFSNATQALLAQIVELEDVKERVSLKLEAKGETPQERFLGWLRELLYNDLTRGFLVARTKDVLLSKDGDVYLVSAEAWGEELDASRHRLLHEVKTVTYQDFLYGRVRDFWRARVVFDV